MVVAAVALSAVVGLGACAAAKDALSGEAARELADETGAAVERRAADAGVLTTDYGVLSSALHDVVVLDQADSEEFRPRHVGLVDGDGDGLDDDGSVQIVVRDASACLHAEGQRVRVDDGPC